MTDGVLVVYKEGVLFDPHRKREKNKRHSDSIRSIQSSAHNSRDENKDIDRREGVNGGCGDSNIEVESIDISGLIDPDSPASSRSVPPLLMLTISVRCWTVSVEVVETKQQQPYIRKMDISENFSNSDRELNSQAVSLSEEKENRFNHFDILSGSFQYFISVSKRCRKIIRAASASVPDSNQIYRDLHQVDRKLLDALPIFVPLINESKGEEEQFLLRIQSKFDEDARKSS